MKNLRNLGLFLFTGATLTSCYSLKDAHYDSTKQMDTYMTVMKTGSHVHFMQDKAEADAAQNAKTIKLDKKDTTKNVYLDKFGADARTRDSRLLYDLDHGLTFQIMMRNLKFDEKAFGFKNTAPVLFLDQSEDGKQKNAFDTRFHQVDSANAEKQSRTALDAQENKKGVFELTPDGDVVKHLTLSEALNIRYDLIFKADQRIIVGHCPGSSSKFDQLISTYDDANPVLQGVCERAEDWATGERIRLLQTRPKKNNKRQLD